ncbi:hypothetical protein [Mesorhizobium sp. SP-1A]|uniref:hypothetical protein n=1 Tax=Mesorhizobium sp. SP-1A TaxID=3077840 RepID=UPI0028F6C27B|nr:hypothetical protein [Mesorhizobium sp. SP-1A]
MSKIIKGSVAFLAAQMVGLGVSNSAETCFEPRYVPASYSCNTGAGTGKIQAFDDFSSGSCTFIEAHTVQVPIECPKPAGRWVNATFTKKIVNGGKSNHNMSNVGVTAYIATGHAQTCSSVGLKPSSFEGNICASGENRANSGGNGWNQIDYRFGTFGGYVTGGGTLTEQLYEQTFCWRAGDKRDWDNSDRLVAWYCQ